jgi:hypothetical protein
MLTEAQNANLRGPALKQRVYDPHDVARTTTKQATLTEAQNANLRGPEMKQRVYDPHDVARTTTKEMYVAEAPSANLRGPALKQRVYDPDDVARTTAKELNLQDMTASSMMSPGERRPRAAPDQDARATGRETLDQEDTVRNIGSSQQRGLAYDPEQWRPDVTLKQVVSEEARAADGQYGSVGALQGQRGGAYAVTEFEAKAVHKQYLVDTGTLYGLAAAPGEQPGSYDLGHDEGAKDTQRQTTTTDYYGTTLNPVPLPVSHEATGNANVSSAREFVAQGRDPTSVGPKAGAAPDALGTSEREPQRSLLHDVSDRVSMPSMPSAPQTLGGSGTGTRERNEYARKNRFEEEVDTFAEQMADNPLVIRLSRHEVNEDNGNSTESNDRQEP